MSDYKVGFIGGGNMATALAGGLVASGYSTANVLIAEPSSERRGVLAAELDGVQIGDDNSAVAAQADCVVLAVKPQVMQDVCAGVASTVQRSKPLILSVAAGNTSHDIDRWLGGGNAVVRVMPNQPALLRQGVSGLYANEKTSDEQVERAVKILSVVGNVVRVPREEDIDAVTAVSGSGPAYFYFLIDTMLRTARDLGLSPEAAHTLVMDTARGAVALARDSDEPMEAMIARVRSPGGTTEAALEVLENKNVRDTFATAITTARNRAAELANEVGN